MLIFIYCQTLKVICKNILLQISIIFSIAEYFINKFLFFFVRVVFLSSICVVDDIDLNMLPDTNIT